jgi:hypothetical protein
MPVRSGRDRELHAEPPEPAPERESAPPDRPAGGRTDAGGHVRSALELIGLVAAPTTILAAFAFFFGWTFTNVRTSYFGIDPSTLGFSTQDYLLRSTDALFVPVGAALVLALFAVAVHSLVSRALGDVRLHPALRWAAGIAVIAGAALFAVGVSAVFDPLPFSPHYLFPSASLGIGIALLAYGLHLRGRLDALHASRPTEDAGGGPSRPSPAAALVALLVVLSGFWTASEYAEELALGRAKTLEATIDSRPSVTVFAPQRLHIKAPGVVERRLRGADSAYRYRYSGLRLLVRSGGKYFLLPKDWSHATGAAIVLRDTRELRFEFEAGR